MLTSVLFTLGWVLLGALSVGALVALAVSEIRRRYGERDAAAAIYFATTRDGARLALHRYPPAERRASPPVILCHGLASNRFQVDLEGKSLARALSARGHDVWVLELRGAGYSRPPEDAQVTFDDYVAEDLPAALSRVLAETGAAKAHWVGFSTGAMAMYAHASRQEAPLASLVGLGAPTRFIDQPNLRRFATAGRFLSFFGREVRLSIATTLFAPLGGRMNPRLIKAVLNRENVGAAVIRRGLANAVTNISRDALRQYADWVMNDQFRSIDRRLDYRRELGRLRAPLLLIAGAQDILAPPSSMEELVKEAGATRKELKIAGRDAGFARGYGHADLAYGEAVEAEVFRWIYEWLEGGYGGESEAPGEAA